MSNEKNNPFSNIGEQITNISKAGAYDIVSEQAQKLDAENKALRERVKELEEALTRARDWFYVHSKKNGKIYADGVKPACIPYIEIALNNNKK